MSSSSGIQNYIPCANHPSKLAKKYCSHADCKAFLCNACVLDAHVSHIDMVQNLNSLYIKNVDFLKKLLSVSEKRKTQSTNLTFKCMNFVFHQAKHFCKQCKGFICTKCMANHEKNHEFVPLEDYVSGFSNLIDFFISIINYDSHNVHENFDINPVNYIEMNVKIESFLSGFSGVKYKVAEVMKARNNFILNYIEKLHKFYVKKQNVILSNKEAFKKLIKLADDIKFERDGIKVFQFYMEFKNILEKTSTVSMYKHSVMLWKQSKKVQQILQCFQLKTLLQVV